MFFVSISKKTSLSKLLFRFTSIALSFAFYVSEHVYTIDCAVPGCVYTTGAWAPSGRVCTTEDCTASGGAYTTRGWRCIWTCLHYRGVSCSWRCLTQGLSCIWTCLHYRGMCCSWRCLPQRPELNLDVSALQRYCMCLIHRDQCILTVKRVRFTSKIICLLSDVFASLQK